MAYSFRAVDGGCSIWAPDASELPSGWSLYSGDGATIINHTNGNELAYCMKKKMLILAANGSESRLLSVGNAGSATSSRGLTVGIGIGGAVILLCCLFIVHRHFVTYLYMGTKHEGVYADAPVEVWEKKVTDKHEYLAQMFYKLDEIEQSADSPPGYITQADLTELALNRPFMSKLSWLGFSYGDCETAFKKMNTDGSGKVLLDDFLEECMRAHGGQSKTLFKARSYGSGFRNDELDF
jgi:hypothetical protein